MREPLEPMREPLEPMREPQEPMRVVRSGELAPTSWANGRGVTRELFAGEGWRVSLAEIGAPGPFSSYAGVERHFALVHGVVRLRFPGGEVAEVNEGANAISFRGEDAPECEPELASGHCAALNLMVSRGSCRGSIARVRIEPETPLVLAQVHGPRVVVVQNGRVDACGHARPEPDATWRLDSFDALLADCAGELRAVGADATVLIARVETARLEGGDDAD